MTLLLILLFALNPTQVVLCINHDSDIRIEYRHDSGSDIENEDHHCHQHHCTDYQINHTYHRNHQIDIIIPIIAVMIPHTHNQTLRPIISRLIETKPTIRPPPEPFYHQQHLACIKATIIRI